MKHWNRLLDGVLYASSPRVDWASLLRRSFDVDVLACASCGGRLRVLGEVTDPAMVRLVLDSLGMPTDVPRARDPTDWLGEHDVAQPRRRHGGRGGVCLGGGQLGPPLQHGRKDGAVSPITQ